MYKLTKAYTKNTEKAFGDANNRVIKEAEKLYVFGDCCNKLKKK